MTSAGPDDTSSEELERSEKLIEEAKSAAPQATTDTHGDPDLDSDAFPHPGDDGDPAPHI